MNAMASEPAIKSYFFGKGYVDLRNTIAECWQRNLASAREQFGKVRTLWPGEAGHKAMAVLRGSAGVSVVLFGTVFFVALTILHVAVLATFFLMIYLGFTIVYGVERAFLAWRQFATVCPDCHSKNPLPEYFCRKCSAVHRRLMPSQYGILHHTCTCGEKLPAAFFLQRGMLQSRCPDCHHLLALEHTEARKIFLPVFGGPSVGKSAFLFSAVDGLIEESKPLGLVPSFLDKLTETDLARVRHQLGQGFPPDKTTASLPRAWNIRFEHAGQSPRLLYVYDPAGEAFRETDGLVLHSYQRYLSGLIFLIDPFTIPAVQDEYAAPLAAARDGLKPSPLPVEDVFSRILIGMEEHFGLGKAGRIKEPVAVVINKVDAFDLEQRIGEAAVIARLQASATPLTREAARDQVVREQLVRWRQADLVQQIEARCARLRYFSCSALGRIPDGSTRAFVARGVTEPLLWILSAADPAFRHGRPRGV